VKKTTQSKQPREAFRELSPEVSQVVQGGEDFPPPPPRAHIITGG